MNSRDDYRMGYLWQTKQKAWSCRKEVLEKFLGKEIVPESNSCELYFEAPTQRDLSKNLGAVTPW